VPEQPESRDVRGPTDVTVGRDLGGHTVEPEHALHGTLDDVDGRFAVLRRGGDDARAERLGEEEPVSRTKPALDEDAIGVNAPVTQRPYFGSASITVCPPAITPPASATFSAPPRKTSAMIAFGSSRGNPATASANMTWPPIAYTSDIAFAAATAPHV